MLYILLPRWLLREGGSWYVGSNRAMGKRIMLTVVGAGLGAIFGVLASSFGAGTAALYIGAALGAVIPLVWLGQPGS